MVKAQCESSDVEVPAAPGFLAEKHGRGLSFPTRAAEVARGPTLRLRSAASLTHAAPAGAPKGRKNAKNVNASPGAGPSR